MFNRYSNTSKREQIIAYDCKSSRAGVIHRSSNTLYFAVKRLLGYVLNDVHDENDDEADDSTYQFLLMLNNVNYMYDVFGITKFA